MIKRLSWALAISIGLNLFLLGFGAARAWRGHGGPAHRPGLMRMLGPPSPELRAQHHELEAARKRVAEAFAAEPYDRTRAEHALADLRARVTRSQELLHQHLLERADTLPPEERRRLAGQRFAPEH
ncbi:MAG TPA: periplasmic heavy metal sensor [Polyangiales bacterium]